MKIQASLRLITEPKVPTLNQPMRLSTNKCELIPIRQPQSAFKAPLKPVSPLISQKCWKTIIASSLRPTFVPGVPARVSPKRTVRGLARLVKRAQTNMEDCKPNVIWDEPISISDDEAVQPTKYSVENSKAPSISQDEKVQVTTDNKDREEGGNTSTVSGSKLIGKTGLIYQYNNLP